MISVRKPMRIEDIFKSAIKRKVTLYIDPHFFNLTTILKKAQRFNGLVISISRPEGKNGYMFINSLGDLIER